MPCTDLAEAAADSPTTVTVTGSKWLCQLQDGDPTAIGATGFDIVVIDYSRDGGESGRYSGTEMDTLKNGRGFTRQVLSYLSIGEAEEYRYYFKPEWVSGRARRSAGSPAARSSR